MCPRLGSHAPSCGWQLPGAAQLFGVSLTTEGTAPASLRYFALTPLVWVAAPGCLAPSAGLIAGSPVTGCFHVSE